MNGVGFERFFDLRKNVTFYLKQNIGVCGTPAESIFFYVDNSFKRCLIQTV